MSDRVFNVRQPIVFKDGTMQYPFRDFVTEVDIAITNAALTSVWGSVSGDITTQDDLFSGGKIIASLIPESGVTQHEAALSIATSQLTGNMPDARIVSSNVTQHEGDLSISWSQISGAEYVQPTFRNESGASYTLALSDSNTVIRFTANNAAVTIPDNSTVAFPSGTEVYIRQAGTGTLVLTTTGLTINGTVPSWSQHVEAGFRKVGTDEWDVM